MRAIKIGKLCCGRPAAAPTVSRGAAPASATCCTTSKPKTKNNSTPIKAVTREGDVFLGSKKRFMRYQKYDTISKIRHRYCIVFLISGTEKDGDKARAMLRSASTPPSLPKRGRRRHLYS